MQSMIRKKALGAAFVGALLGVLLVVLWTVGGMLLRHTPADATAPNFTLSSLIIPCAIFAVIGAFIGWLSTLNQPRD